MDLFKPKTMTGEWFPFGDGELLVRLIPADIDAKMNLKHFGSRTRADIEKEGGDHLGAVTLSAYLLDRACYALVGSKNLWAPEDMVTQALPKVLAAGTEPPEKREDGMVRLDGFWSEDMKRLVLHEVMSPGELGFHILDCSKDLSAKAERRKGKLGKA